MIEKYFWKKKMNDSKCQDMRQYLAISLFSQTVNNVVKSSGVKYSPLCCSKEILVNINKNNLIG